MEEDRINKAWKASFVILQAICTSDKFSVKLALSLFDKQIEPILLYGCPIWGIPSSNCSIRLKYNKIETKQLKKQVHIHLEAIDASQANIVSCRYCKSSGEVSETLSNIMDKIIVLNNRNRFPSTFEIRDYEIHKQSMTETFYYKYCKYALGISKYSSNVLTLGESNSHRMFRVTNVPIVKVHRYRTHFTTL